MKFIIAGSRSVVDYDHLLSAIKYFDLSKRITEIISGTALGADKLGERYAKEHNVLLVQMPAKWNKYGRSAGPLRNVEMAKYAEGLLALWDMKSAGTKSMISIAEQKHLFVYIYKVIK